MPNLYIPHIVLTVKNFEESKRFYKDVFIDTLGCEVKIEEEDFFYFRINDSDQSIGIAPEIGEFSESVFSRYRVGLHHFAVELESRSEVDRVYNKIVELGMVILDEPQVFAEYGSNYYAFYYLDPNGFKGEFTAFKD
jgi:catechol 2,3-dioxygenase-like lactoylglutathione lyase family enzyme